MAATQIGPAHGLCQFCTTCKRFDNSGSPKHNKPVQEAHISPHGHKRLSQQFEFCRIHDCWNRSVAVLLSTEIDKVGPWMIQELSKFVPLYPFPLRYLWRASGRRRVPSCRARLSCARWSSRPALPTACPPPFH